VRAAASVHGTFRITGLEPGRYDLFVSAPGFADRVVADLDLEAGSTISLEIGLDLALVKEQVTVVGTAPREGISLGALRESAARDVGEALAASPGIWKLRKGGIANDVVVRGLQSRDLNVLIDGQRLHGACPNRMDPAPFHVDFAEVERIEVTSGPFDLRNQGSLGGLVNIVTKRPAAGWHAVPALALGSDGFANPSLTASYGSPRGSVLGGGSYRRSLAATAGDGLRFTERANYRPEAIDREAYRVWTAWARAGLAPAAGHQIQAAYTWQSADAVLYPYLLMDAVYDDTQRLNATYEAGPSGWRPAIRVQTYHARVDHWMTDAYRASAAGSRGYSMGTFAATRTTGGRVDVVAGPITAGVEAFRRRWDARTELAARQYVPQFSIPDVVVDTAGGFVEGRWHAGHRVTIEAGARLDRSQAVADAEKASTALYLAYKGTTRTVRTDVFPSARAGLTWSPTGDIRVTAGVGSTVRVPEPTERFFALARMGTDWVGNPDLDPTRNTGVDLGVSLARAGATLAATVWAVRVAGFVAVHDQPRRQAVPGVMNARARSYANIDARLHGTELAAGVPVGRRFYVSTDVSYTRGSAAPRPDLGLTSGDLAEMPPLRGRLRVRFDDGRLFAGAEAVAAARQRHVDRTLGEQPTPGYAVLNLQAGLRHGPVAVTAGVSNLLDRFYVEHLSYQRDPYRTGVRVPEPGRNVFFTVSWRF
jgi:iron complex outermembrane receptor protein